ncbi:MoaD/ThiS family protein [uncultured Campylobacter sp.]|uniref:MoaD/ThiS family protein n=1 Tax=uncultured Campylobacter sp. TaxID=218934 RepID=UPI0026339616|nr:MoaD/ThiS family protein [uncultured Campylobacter sp.]
MIRVEFLGPIKRESLEIDISNLRELKELFANDKELKEWLKISSVAINDTIVDSLDVGLKDGDVISILPPVCGG